MRPSWLTPNAAAVNPQTAHAVAIGPARVGAAPIVPTPDACTPGLKGATFRPAPPASRDHQITHSRHGGGTNPGHVLQLIYALEGAVFFAIGDDGRRGSGTDSG